MLGLVSTLLNQTYSVPARLVHACLQVTEQVWQPMHLSRFITIAIWAMTLTAQLLSRESSRLGAPARLDDEAKRAPASQPRRKTGRCSAPSTRERSERRSIRHLLRPLADHGHLVTLVAGRAEVVEGERQLGVAADQVAGL